MDARCASHRRFRACRRSYRGIAEAGEIAFFGASRPPGRVGMKPAWAGMYWAKLEKLAL